MVGFLRKISVISVFLCVLASCGANEESNKAKDGSYGLASRPASDEGEVYRWLASQMDELKQSKAGPLKLSECRCKKGFKRDLNNIDNSVRFQADRNAVKFLSPLKTTTDKINLFFFGSGKLMQELTIIARLAQVGLSQKVFLNDHAYAFYKKDVWEQVRKFRQKPADFPDWLRHYFIWDSKHSDAEARDFFRDHNEAIDEFKALVAALAQYYHVTIDVEVFASDSEARRSIKGRKVDAYFAMDSFVPASALIWRVQQDLTDEKSDANFDLLLFALNKDIHGFYPEEADKNESSPVYLEVWQGRFDFNKEFYLKRLVRAESP